MLTAEWKQNSQRTANWNKYDFCVSNQPEIVHFFIVLIEIKALARIRFFSRQPKDLKRDNIEN